MDSRNAYRLALESVTPTEDQKKKLEELEEYIKLKKQYNEYAPDMAQEIERDYNHEIEYLKSLQQMNPNPTYQKSIEKHEELQKIISLEEQKTIKEEKDYERTLKRNLNFEKRAGFTNATILIFVVCNLGLFLATLLLLFK